MVYWNIWLGNRITKLRVRNKDTITQIANCSNSLVDICKTAVAVIAKQGVRSAIVVHGADIGRIAVEACDLMVLIAEVHVVGCCCAAGMQCRTALVVDDASVG